MLYEWIIIIAMHHHVYSNVLYPVQMRPKKLEPDVMAMSDVPSAVDNPRYVAYAIHTTTARISKCTMYVICMRLRSLTWNKKERYKVASCANNAAYHPNIKVDILEDLEIESFVTSFLVLAPL